MRDLDGQAWFRLASVFGHLDEGRLAENAYLRAWQCGELYMHMYICNVCIVLCMYASFRNAIL